MGSRANTDVDVVVDASPIIDIDVADLADSQREGASTLADSVSQGLMNSTSTLAFTAIIIAVGVIISRR